MKQLNFSEKETKTYLALLESGSARASDISRMTELNRTTTYDCLASLIKKGLVSKYKKKSATFFSVLEPNELLDYLDREKEENSKEFDKKKKKLSSLIPQLVSLQSMPNSRPMIKFFEGEKGMREAYEDTLHAKGKILAYANVQTMHQGLPNLFPEYYKRRAKSKIFIHAISPNNISAIERSKKDQEEMRKIRFLPSSEMTFSPEINIYNNKMLVVSWKEKMAIVIESKELADLQRLIFNIVWDILPEKMK